MIESPTWRSWAELSQQALKPWWKSRYDRLDISSRCTRQGCQTTAVWWIIHRHTKTKQAPQMLQRLCEGQCKTCQHPSKAAGILCAGQSQWHMLTRNAHGILEERHESITEAWERGKEAATVSMTAETGQLTFFSLPTLMPFQNWTPQPPESPQQMGGSKFNLHHRDRRTTKKTFRILDSVIT